MILNTLLLAAAVTILPGIYSTEDDTPPAPDTDETEISTDPDTEEEEENSFLDPYYESKDTTGCALVGCSDLWDIIGIIPAVDVRYNSNPAENGGVRAFLGGAGNSVALNVRFGLSGIEESPGYVAGVMLRTPSPIGFDILYHRVNSNEPIGFSLLYTGVVSQLVYCSPLQLMLGAQAVFPIEDERETLAGAGLVLLGKYSFQDRIGLSFDYRLVWIRGLSLHRGEMRISWSSAPIELYAGYIFLLNSVGYHIPAPCAGAGLFF